MRKLIYTILVLIIIVVAAFLVSPYFLGSRAQEQFHDEIALFNKTPPYSSYITITPESYQRHWFSSDAQVKVTFHTPQSSHQHINKSFTYNAIIKHGPLFFISNDGKSSLHMGAGAILIKGDTADFNGIIAVSLSWGDHLNVYADIPTLTLKDSQGNNFTFHNLKFTTKPGSNDQVVYKLLLPKFTAQVNTSKPAGTVNINNTKLVVSGREDKGAWLGTGNFTIANLAANINEKGVEAPIANMKNFSASIDNNLTSDKTKLNSQLNLNIESLTAVGKTIKPITISYGVDGVNADAYRQFKVSIDKVQASQAATGSPSFKDAMSAVNAVLKIIESGLTFKVNKIYVGLPKNLASSPLSANAQLTVKPITNLSQKIAALVGAAARASQASGHQAASQSRDELLSGLTHIQPQHGSTGSQQQRQMQLVIAKATPILLGSLIHAVAANGQASIPESLVKQGLLQRYTEELMHMAAHGQNVTQTPQDLASDAYNYLTGHKMLIANNDGSMKIHFNFAKGELLINGEKPAFDLPKPGTQPAQAIPAKITPAQPASS